MSQPHKNPGQRDSNSSRVQAGALGAGPVEDWASTQRRGPEPRPAGHPAVHLPAARDGSGQERPPAPAPDGSIYPGGVFHSAPDHPPALRESQALLPDPPDFAAGLAEWDRRYDAARATGRGLELGLRALDRRRAGGGQYAPAPVGKVCVAKGEREGEVR